MNLTQKEVKALLEAVACCQAAIPEGGDFGSGKRYETLMTNLEDARQKLQSYSRDKHKLVKLLDDAMGALSTLHEHSRIHSRLADYLKEIR